MRIRDDFYGEKNCPLIVQLWILRLMLKTENYNTLMSETGFNSIKLAKLFKLNKWLKPNVNFLKEEVIADLQHRKNVLENETTDNYVNEYLETNLNNLQSHFHLTNNECQVLKLYVTALNDHVFIKVINIDLYIVDTVKLVFLISSMLNLNNKDVFDVFDKTSELYKTGLLVDSPKIRAHFPWKLDFISEMFPYLAYNKVLKLTELIWHKAIESTPASLTLNDYDYLEHDIQTILRFLQSCFENKVVGVNICIHGQTGTGKTQLAKILAKEMGVKLYEINNTYFDGHPKECINKLKAYQVTQKFFKNDKLLIVYDDCDEVFVNGNDIAQKFINNDKILAIHDDCDDVFIFDHSCSSSQLISKNHKGWIKNILETNSNPAIWILDEIDGVDLAFMRRFDIVLELPLTHKNERLKV